MPVFFSPLNGTLLIIETVFCLFSYCVQYNIKDTKL